jgi:hypothetical protein
MSRSNSTPFVDDPMNQDQSTQPMYYSQANEEARQAHGSHHPFDTQQDYPTSFSSTTFHSLPHTDPDEANLIPSFSQGLSDRRPYSPPHSPLLRGGASPAFRFPSSVDPLHHEEDFMMVDGQNSPRHGSQLGGNQEMHDGALSQAAGQDQYLLESQSSETTITMPLQNPT